MKKLQKLFIASLLIGGMTLSAAGCKQSGQPFVPPESDGGKVTINDAYDWNDDKTGSNRPGLGGDYEAQLPPTEAVVTIAENSSIRFKGGLTSITLPVGKLLKTEDFEESTLGGKTVEGVAALDADGKIKDFQKLQDFVPLEAVTVLPYFAPEHGDAYILGSNRVGDYYYDENGNDLEVNSEYKIKTENVLVDGGMGRLFTLDKALNAGSYFRCVTVLEREAGQQYTYYYTVENRGDKAISFTMYQMHGGHNWSDSETAVAGDPVTLQPGDKANISFVVDNAKNDGNTLTLIKLDENCEGFNLAVAMAMDNTTERLPATITLKLPAGFNVSDDYATSVYTNDKLVLPKASQITNETGHKLLYWEYEDGTRVTEGVRIKGDLTIRPVLTEDAHITFELPANFTINADYLAANSKLQTGDRLTLPTAEQFNNQTGLKFIRWVDGEGNPLANTFVVNGSMTIKAELAQRATINVQLPAGLTLSGDYNKTSMTGEVLVAPTANQISGTIADGRQIQGWYIVGNGNQVITDKTIITSPNVTIAPYFTRRAGTATMCNFEDASYNGKELVFSNVQSSNKPMNVGGGGQIGNFNAVNKWDNIIGVGGGENGYAEKGNLITYSGTLKEGAWFRCGTIISDGDAVVQLNAEHTFYYNFENLGDSAIHLDLQAVNYVYNVEGPVNKIDLEPGESTLITFKVTYTKGSPNKNIMSYFRVTSDTVNMKLGVSINFEAGKEQAKVSLKDGIDGFTLSDEYLAKKYYVGDTLTLPTAGDYTDTNSANRTVIGWKDASGNELHDGDVIKGNIVLVPVFEEFVNVTVELPEGITLNGYDLVKRYKVGDKLVLPTEAQITNTIGREIQYWVIKDTTTVVTNETVIDGAITIVPVIAPEQREEAVITLADVEGFSVSQEYFAETQYVGGLLVLPSEDEITNNTGKEFRGWKDKEGNILTENTVINGNIELHPILVETVTVNVKLPDTITLKDSYNTVCDKDSKLALPAAEDLDLGTSGMGAPAGWYNVATRKIISDDVTLTENITISPYWSAISDYNQVKVGSASARGYNTDEMIGDLAAHFKAEDNTSAKYTGCTTTNSNGVLVEGEYTLLGSSLSDTQKITAGSAIRLDSKHPQTVGADTVLEYSYTVENKGAHNLRISIYQISGSSEYKVGAGYYGYESRYRVDINLAPGDSVTKTAQYMLGKNGNALTYIVFEEDAETLDFGIAISSKILGAASSTEIADEYKNQAALVNDVTIAYDKEANGGIEVKAEWLTKRAGKYVMAPDAGSITVPEGVTVTGWQLVLGGGIVYDLDNGELPESYDKVVLLPSSGATLKAVYTVAGEAEEGV